MKNIIKPLLLCFFLLSLAMQAKAHHILSGSMSYACTSQGEYDVTITLFRDCFGEGPFFDTEVSIAIYEGESLIPYQELVISELALSEVIFDPYAGCDPNTVLHCVEKGIYTFQVSLPLSIDSYHIVYQRCCWAEDILNIANPEDTGITVTTELTHEGQLNCNSQLIIDTPMAFSSCPGEPFSIILPLEDLDGDSLAYTICMPLQGGGTLGKESNPGDPTLCNGLIPSPPCAGPYSSVTYADGFDNDFPFPSDDGVIINAETGEITFVPTELGRYVFGLCITEYGDGGLLSITNQAIMLNNTLQRMTSTIPEKNEDTKIWFDPITKLIRINISQTDISRIAVCDMMGKLVYNSDQDLFQEISTYAWIPGVYVVQLRNANQLVSVSKVIVH